MTRNYWLIILISAGLAVTGCSSLINSPSGSEYPAIWLADGFDFPVGDRNGRGWAVTGYGFLDWSIVSNSYHPGEDWNIPGAGNGDWGGEPVYAVANGEVIFFPVGTAPWATSF